VPSFAKMAHSLCSADAISQAIKLAGADDFGPHAFREGLERSLTAFEPVPLKPEMRAQVHKKIVEDLANRLRVERWYKDHPEIDEDPVEGPILVLGLPRTGTTATVSMLGLDQRFRFLRGWEATTPVPPPIAAEEESDPRVVAARDAAKSYAMAHLHLFDPDGSQEDLAYLAGMDMHAYHGAYPMPKEYVDWWLSDDFRSTYAYLDRIFKLLHSRRGPRLWLLKSPPHLFRLEAIVRQFPRVKFVMTHRDPRNVIASVASLQCSLYEERCLPGSVDRCAVGRQLLSFWKEGVRRGLMARAALGEERFVDIWNDDVVKQPLTAFKRIYEHIGMEVTPAHIARLAEYTSRNAPGNFGQHQYTLEQYGLSERNVRDAFAAYYSRFLPGV
jgi:hypothetical protein